MAQDNTHGDPHYMSTQAVSLSAMFPILRKNKYIHETQKVQHEKRQELYEKP